MAKCLHLKTPHVGTNIDFLIALVDIKCVGFIGLLEGSLYIPYDFLKIFLLWLLFLAKDKIYSCDLDCGKWIFIMVLMLNYFAKYILL